MRQGQQHKRMRGRGRKGPNPLSRSYESNGPDVKIRGTALQVAEKYLQLSRDAQAAGDRVHSENLLQHAEHYFRIVAAAQAQAQASQPQPPPRNEGDNEGAEEARGNGQNLPPQPTEEQQPAFGLSDPQPFVNGNGRDPEAAPEEAEEPKAEPAPRRPRRRRTYRERQEEQSGNGQRSPAEPEPAAAAPVEPESAAAAPASDD